MMATGKFGRGKPISDNTINDVVRIIGDRFKPEQIILFGSYAVGMPTPDSDLDLLVIMPSDLPRHKRAVPMHLLFRPVPCPMDILVYTPEEVAYWNGTINHIVTEAIASGKVVYGRPRD